MAPAQSMTVPASPAPGAIKTARAAARLTQTEAAALIYCTLRGWQDWEGGKRAMHPAFFELFLLKCSLPRTATPGHAMRGHPVPGQRT